jgi:ubiquinone/menaquinone biosynthesis C-methylase UbiE
VADDALRRSWSSLSTTRSRAFLDTQDAASTGSKRLLAEVLAQLGRGRALELLDLGCGNAQLYTYFKAAGLPCRYTGVDYSEPLLAAAREAHRADELAKFVTADVITLEGVEGHHDVAIFSHVLEMLSSPQEALASARRVADVIAIRFFEPPVHEADTVELRQLDAGDGRSVPYLRRKISRDHYRLMLARIGCRKVDVYRDETSTDQVHVLRFA